MCTLGSSGRPVVYHTSKTRTRRVAEVSRVKDCYIHCRIQEQGLLAYRRCGETSQLLKSSHDFSLLVTSSRRPSSLCTSSWLSSTLNSQLFSARPDSSHLSSAHPIIFSARLKWHKCKLVQLPSPSLDLFGLFKLRVFYYTEELLHRGAFTQRICFAQSKLLHREVFTQSKVSHRELFSQRSLSTEKFLHRANFSQRSSYTEKFSHRESATQDPPKCRKFCCQKQHAQPSCSHYNTIYESQLQKT